MRDNLIHKRLTLTLRAILLVAAAVALWGRQWLTAMTTIAIILVTLSPILIHKRWRVYIPPEFEVVATVFLFASLFLGEVRGFYIRPVRF